MLSEFPTLLKTEEAARRIGVSASTLAKWRVSGQGPRYVKIGRNVAYRETDLLLFLDERNAGSTSEYQAQVARADHD